MTQVSKLKSTIIDLVHNESKSFGGPVSARHIAGRRRIDADRLGKMLWYYADSGDLKKVKNGGSSYFTATSKGLQYLKGFPEIFTDKELAQWAKKATKKKKPPAKKAAIKSKPAPVPPPPPEPQIDLDLNADALINHVAAVAENNGKYRAMLTETHDNLLRIASKINDFLNETRGK